jgi:hypothetical protein
MIKRKNDRILFCVLISLFLFSCSKKETVIPPVPAKQAKANITLAITNVTAETALCTGSITYNGADPISSSGICWNTEHTPTINDDKVIFTGTDSFKCSLTKLIINTGYYVRAYVTNSAGTTYSPQIFFKTVPALCVGQVYRGGLIAYFLEPGDDGYDPQVLHGLIVTPMDQSKFIKWSEDNHFIGKTGKAIGSGKTNTSKIVNFLGNGIYAAKICDDLVLNGYDDWYLPSIEELNKLFFTNGIFITKWTNNSYCSSSEYSSGTVYQNGLFDHSCESSGYIGPNLKTYNYAVRAIRSF